MKCSQCGEANEKDSRFCQSCGEPLVPANPLKKLLYKQNTIRPDMHDPNRARAASPNEVMPGEVYEPRRPSEKKRRRRRARQRDLRIPRDGAHVTIRRGRTAKQTQSDRVYRSRLPFVITAFLTAFLSIFQFIIPFFGWVSYEYEVADLSTFSFSLENMSMNSPSNDELDLIELAGKFYQNEDIYTFITGDPEFNYDDSLVDNVLSSISSDYTEVKAKIEDGYSKGRTAAFAVSCVFLAGLVLYIVFIALVLLRRRIGAAAIGITASLFYAAGCIGVMYAVNLVNQVVEKNNVIKYFIDAKYQTLDMPYVGLALSGAIIMLCVVFVILGINTRRR